MSWSHKAFTQKGFPRSRHSAVVKENNVLAFGGESEGEPLNSMVEFSTGALVRAAAHTRCASGGRGVM